MKSLLRVFVSPRVLGPLCGGLALLALATGCANTGGEYSYVTRIATGERMTFPLIKGNPELAKAGTITVRLVGLNRAPESPKRTMYQFGIEERSGRPPKSIRVDDVSEKTIFPLVEDLHPELRNNLWLGTSKTLDGTAPELYWLPYLDQTTRVFRFTITTADGHEVVLYQAWFVAAWVKGALRTALDIKN